MKRNKLIMKTINIGLVSLLTLILFSCSNTLTTQTSLESTLSEDGKTYLVVKRASLNTSREGQSTINPEITNEMKADILFNLHDFKLYATPVGNSDAQVLVQATNYDDLLDKKIPIVAGEWRNVRLEAKLNIGTAQSSYNITYAETKSANIVIKPGELNFIEFALKTSSNGGVAVTMNFKGDADSVKVQLKSKTKGDLSYSSSKTKTFTTFENVPGTQYKSFVYGLSRTEISECIPTDSYYLLFEFYKNGLTTPLNSVAYIINVEAGFVTEADLYVDLNKSYTIKYKYFIDGVEQTVADGALPEGVTITDDGELPGNIYSSKQTSGQLPDLELDGYTFAGWYSVNNYLTDYLNNVPAGSSGENIVCAYFFSPRNVFVSSGGMIDDDGSSYDHPAQTIPKAIETLSGISEPEEDWNLVIIGEVENMDHSEGEWVIDSTLTTDNIKSLTIYGARGLDGSHVPRDSISGGYYEYGNDRGTTLTIDTEVPVHIKNLKITGGYTDSCNGAGLSVINSSHVYLEEGTLICGNQTVSSGAGAGIALFGSAIVTMNAGSIEDNTSDSDADGDVGGGGVLLYGTDAQFIMNGGTIRNNTATGFGGGVCVRGGTFTMNEGAVIGGSSKADANKSTDGINGSGGGVYIGTGSFIMNGGTISNNESCVVSGTAGGGVCVINADSSFTMKGGTISDNSATANGKGIYVSPSAHLNMGKSAFVDADSDNDIYLKAGAVITIVESFDDDFGQNNPVAIITPETYGNITVLDADTNAGINLANEYDVFVVTPQVTGESPNQKTVIWQVNEEGKLYKELSPIESFVSSITSLTTSQTITAPEIEVTADDLVAIADALNELATNRPAVEVTLDLKNLTGVTSVSSYTYSEVGRYDLFDGNTNLVEITLPSSLNDLNALFYGCSKLKTINIPGTITNELDTGFCTGCKALEKITLWNSTTEAFEESGSFNGYRIEKRAIYTGNILCIYYGKAFEQAPEFAEGITTIYGNAFNSCSMTSVEIPDTVTLMESEVFYNCKKLSSVVLSSGLSNIQASTFYNCTSLTTVTIPNSPLTIKASAFPNCDALTTVNYLGTEEERNSKLVIESNGNEKLTGATWHYQTTLPTGFASVTGDGDDIPNMYVAKNMITQSEYEQYMTYYALAREAEKYVPAETDNKDTVPAYFVSWADAIIYCNLLSIRDGLQPVYTIGVDTDPEEMKGSYGITKVGSKYYVASEFDNTWNDNNVDGGYVKIDETKTGYRLATVAEYEYIAEKNALMTLDIIGNNGIYEWCRDYQDYRKRAYFTGDISTTVESSNFAYMCHTSHDWGRTATGFTKIGFRIVSSGTTVTGTDFVSVEGNGIISDLKVCKHMVTQSEYESLMTYFGSNKGTQWSSYVPQGNKDTTPAYYLTMADAIIYCNLRSLDEGLDVVYTMDDDKKENPADWGDYGVLSADGKYYLATDMDGSWDYYSDGGVLHIDESKNGYRIVESSVYEYINSQNSGNSLGLTSDSNIFEWCSDYNPYASENSTYLTGDITGNLSSSSFSSIYHTTHEWGSGTDTLKIGFRVVRNVQ